MFDLAHPLPVVWGVMNAPRAMVLAAGLGTRLRPLTDRLPKPLVPVANRPVLDYALAALRRAGISEVAINLHHLGEALRAHVGDGARFGLRVRYSPEDPILGTGGGVARLRDFLAGGTFLLLNGDVLCGADLAGLLQFHRARGAVATMLVRALPAGTAYTSLGLDEAGYLVDFKGAKRPPRGAVRPVMFSGIHVLEPRVFEFLPPSGYACINDQAYVAMVRQGLPVLGQVDEGPWFDLGTPPTYLMANRAVVSGRAVFRQLALPADQVASDGVLIGAGVRVGAGVQLGPEVVIGDGCSLGDGCALSRCVVWPGTQLAPQTVLDSVIAAGALRVPAG
jgi:mannose-1-phosphate guanylyltransferase